MESYSMKHIYLLLFTLAFGTFGFAQNITTQNFTNQMLPAGWSQNNVTFPSGYALFTEVPTPTVPAYLTSPSFSVSSYGSIVVDFQAAKVANGQEVFFAVEYSIDGGPFQLGTTVSPANNLGFVQYSLTIDNPGTTIRVRFSKSSGRKDAGLRNLVITGNCTPTTQATNLSATNFNTPSVGNATLNWTRGSGQNVLVVMRQGSLINANPVSGNPYTANPAFGSGQQIGTGNFVVYNGPSNTPTVSVSNLLEATTYFVAIYEYNSPGLCYKSPALSGSFATPNCNAQSSNFSLEYINRVQLNSIDNTSTGSTYTYYSALSTDLGRGTNYPITITPFWTITPTNVGYGVWIDFNQNNLFEASERVLTQAPTTDASITGNFTIPVNATLGTTRMRVILRNNVAPGPDGCSSFTRGEVEDYNVNIIPPITYSYNNGWTPFDPNGRSTTSNDMFIINGPAVISSTISANSVTVSSTASLTVNAGNTFTVLNNVNMDSNSVNYSSLLVNGTLNSMVNYTRHVNGHTGVGVGAGANDLISAPVSGQTFGVFAGLNTNIRSNPNPGMGTQKLFGPFSKTTGTYLLWDSNAQSGEVLTAGVGYRAASTDNGGFTFSGTANSGIVTNNIVNTTTPGVPFKEWNLVGNPYPTYINAYDFLNYVVDSGTGVKNIDLLAFTGGAIYGYDGDSSDGYTIWNLATPQTNNIAPGQGFLIPADPDQVAAYDLTFAPSMRVIGNTDDFIPGRMANPNNLHLKLRANIGTDNYHTDFYFNDNSSSGLDRGYDAVVFGSIAAAKSIYSHLVDNNNGSDFAIQSLATEALGSDIIVPLGIKATQGQQVTVSIAESDLPSNFEVILEDNVTGTFTQLNDSDYIFTPGANMNTTGRFFLRFADQTLSTSDSVIRGLQIYSTSAPRALFVKGQLADMTSITIYDLQGRVVLTSQLEASSNSNQVDVSNLSSGVYVVKLNNETQQKTQKIILK